MRLGLFLVCLSVVLSPAWGQVNNRAIKREREQMVSEQRVALVIGNGAYKNSPLRKASHQTGQSLVSFTIVYGNAMGFAKGTWASPESPNPEG